MADKNLNNKKIRKKVIVFTIILIVSIVISISFLMKKVTLIIDGESKNIYTFAKTYDDMLKKLEVYISPDDEISVKVEDKIKNRSSVKIKKAKTVSLYVDNKHITHRTTKDMVGDVLLEIGITMGENDKISKALNENINDNDNIKVTRVTSREDIIEEDINFEEKNVKDYKTAIGETRVIDEGQVGKKNLIYNVTYENGVEVKRELIREEISDEPVFKVIGEGIFDPTSISVCVNRLRNLDRNYEPQDLVVPNVRAVVSSSRVMMRSEAATALENLFAGADADGIYLYAVSGYRSYDYQASIYNPYSGYSAQPGASEHQLGLAMDVNAAYYGSSLTTEFGYSAEGQWVKENAHKYGFIVRYLYGKEDITGYYYEPWHIRYVGLELAEKLYDDEITLEEYYGEY